MFVVIYIYIYIYIYITGGEKGKGSCQSNTTSREILVHIGECCVTLI